MEHYSVKELLKFARRHQWGKKHCVSQSHMPYVSGVLGDDSSSNEDRPPNIVWIFADDLGQALLIIISFLFYVSKAKEKCIASGHSVVPIITQIVIAPGRAQFLKKTF